MSSKNKVIVKIHGQEYKLVSDDTREYIQSVANYVDDRMLEVADGNKRLSTAMVAVLTALNIADDHFKLKMEFEALKSRVADPTHDLNHTKEKLSVFQVELNHRNREYEEMTTQFKQLIDNAKLYEGELESLKEKLHVLSYELEYKEKELKTSNQKVKELEQQVSTLKEIKRDSISFSDEG